MMANASKKASIDASGSRPDASNHTIPTTHPEDTSVVLQSQGDQDRFIRALADAKFAIERAIEIGMARLSEVNQHYYIGDYTHQGTSADNAYRSTGASARHLDDLLGDLWLKICSAPIYRLPIELMCLIFGNLDMDSLFACQNTCQRWANILASNAARREVWRGTSVVLHRPLPVVSYKWNRALQNFIEPATLSLKVWPTTWSPPTNNTNVRQWMMDSCIVQHFPASWLREFEYESTGIQCVDHIFWKSIGGCSSLKTLRWTSYGTIYDEYDEPPPTRYQVDAATSCRLEEFKFSSEARIGVDKGFITMLSQVKRLTVDGGMTKSHIKAIFSAAEDFLEDIAVSKIGHYSYEYEWLPHRYDDEWEGDTAPVEVRHSFDMKNLGTFSVEKAEYDGWTTKIEAPHALLIRFDDLDCIDWILLDSCRQNLKSLHLDTKGKKTKGRFAQEIFDMPQLEALRLNYELSERRSHGLIRGQYRNHSAAALWDAFKHQDAELCRMILPKLKHLETTHDPLLDEHLIISFVEMRKLLGQPAVETIKVRLANQYSDSTDKLCHLKKTHPGFDYQLFEEWNDTTQEFWHKWSLVGGVEGRGESLWKTVDKCSGSLRSLKIIPRKVDERLQQALFDLPVLEELTLDFRLLKAEGKERSAVNLWTAVSEANTGKADVSIHDVLPSLRILKAYNDALLDETLIMKLLDLRKSLKMAPIEKIEILLASECSNVHSRLDNLTETMSGFSYMGWEKGQATIADAKSKSDDINRSADGCSCWAA